MTDGNFFPPEKQNQETDEFDSGSASFGECTGLIPSAVLNDEEFESYNEVYNFIARPAHKKDL